MWEISRFKLFLHKRNQYCAWIFSTFCMYVKCTVRTVHTICEALMHLILVTENVILKICWVVTIILYGSPFLEKPGLSIKNWEISESSCTLIFPNNFAQSRGRLLIEMHCDCTCTGWHTCKRLACTENCMGKTNLWCALPPS